MATAFEAIEKTDPNESTPLLGEMRIMSGLPTGPVFYDVDLETGKVQGLFQ